eukprot:940463-Amphidinium_carterae.2
MRKNWAWHASCPQMITSKVKMEYTSIPVNKVGSLDVHQDKFNCGCNWIISMGKDKGGRPWEWVCRRTSCTFEYA